MGPLPQSDNCTSIHLYRHTVVVCSLCNRDVQGVSRPHPGRGKQQVAGGISGGISDQPTIENRPTTRVNAGFPDLCSIPFAGVEQSLQKDILTTAEAWRCLPILERVGAAWGCLA